MTSISPERTRWDFPETVISTSPSKTCTNASNGAVCSLSPCPLSNANRSRYPSSPSGSRG
jgi:hypothetical protein